MKKALLIFSLISLMAASAVSASPVYIYEQTNNSNFNIHVDYGSTNGISVAWFRVKPNVQTLRYWKCHYDGSYYKLKCPEPGGVIQYFKISSDKKWIYMGTHAHKLIKVVN